MEKKSNDKPRNLGVDRLKEISDKALKRNSGKALNQESLSKRPMSMMPKVDRVVMEGKQSTPPTYSIVTELHSALEKEKNA